MPCPRWDANYIPSLVNTGNPRKLKESGPNPPMYDPVRSPECGHCPDLSPLLSNRITTALPHRVTRFVFAPGLRQVSPRPRLCPPRSTTCNASSIPRYAVTHPQGASIAQHHDASQNPAPRRSHDFAGSAAAQAPPPEAATPTSRCAPRRRAGPNDDPDLREHANS